MSVATESETKPSAETLQTAAPPVAIPPRTRAYARRDRRIALDLKVFLLSLAAGSPAVVASMIMLWTEGFTPKVEWTVTVFVVGFWLACSYAARERVVFPLQTLSNLLAALREGDFSIRARGARHDDALGEAMLEVNQLGSILRAQRLG